MRILKCETFTSEQTLVKFVNNNNITREDIFIITRGSTSVMSVDFALFYYADSETKEKMPGWFD